MKNLINKRRVIKAIAVISLIIAFLYVYQRYAVHYSFDNLTIEYVFMITLQTIIIIISLILLTGIVFLITTSFIQRKIINYNIKKSQNVLDRMSGISIISYKHKDNYIRMKFKSIGITIDDWNEKRDMIQSVINYKIIGNIENDKNDYRTIIIHARKIKYSNIKETIDERF